jgi:hypothetical protein
LNDSKDQITLIPGAGAATSINLQRQPTMRSVPFDRSLVQVVIVCALCAWTSASRAADQCVIYKGANGPGQGKHIVLVSGDEEYRSEEALPQLAKILSQRHGFDCTVLFAIDPRTGDINPNVTSNIPGLENLRDADLMVIFTRHRNLPDDQMRHIDEYLKAGKPVIGIRTATHAFSLTADSAMPEYSATYSGDKSEWHGGFGRFVLGEQWVNHHGHHKHESCRGMISPGAENHPILRGIDDGDIWGPSDVYEVRLPLPADSQPLVLGQIVTRKGPYDENDLLYGMRPDDGPPLAGPKNDPMMPIAWMKSYQLPDGARGKAFTSTIGASTDLLNEGVRRLLVNAAYWALGMEEKIPADGADVALVGKYEPTKFEFRSNEYWSKRAMKLDELRDAATIR